jgi:hypothetical protein
MRTHEQRRRCCCAHCHTHTRAMSHCDTLLPQCAPCCCCCCRHSRNHLSRIELHCNTQCHGNASHHARTRRVHNQVIWRQWWRRVGISRCRAPSRCPSRISRISVATARARAALTVVRVALGAPMHRRRRELLLRLGLAIVLSEVVNTSQTMRTDRHTPSLTQTQTHSHTSMLSPTRRRRVACVAATLTHSCCDHTHTHTRARYTHSHAHTTVNLDDRCARRSPSLGLSSLSFLSRSRSFFSPVTCAQ